jgi:regulator of sigma E protease
MAEVSGAMAKLGLGALLNLAAILSISVGLLNFFPIPLLDGGHLLFYAAEAIRGKAMNEKAEQFSINIGFTLVTTLMFFVTYNDVVRLTRQWMR